MKWLLEIYVYHADKENINSFPFSVWVRFGVLILDVTQCSGRTFSGDGKCYLSMIVTTVATMPMWLLSTWQVTSETE